VHSDPEGIEESVTPPGSISCGFVPGVRRFATTPGYRL
jgi:hypothetical protein